MLFNDLMNHHETKKLIELRLRVDKAGSSFVYFTFESNEGLAFYSTLDESIDQNHRDLIVYCSPEFQTDLRNVLEHLKKKVSLEVLSERVIEDRA